MVGILALAALGAVGCGSSGGDSPAVETKPSEVKQNIDPTTQDKIGADLKTWKPQK